MVFPPTITRSTAWTLEEAYRYCERLARTHYENFTVGSLLLPKEKRRHVYAIYGFCRSVDDLGDEATPEEISPADQDWPGKRIRAKRGTPPLPRGELEGGQLTSPDLPFTRGETFDTSSEGITPSDVPAHRLALLDWWQKELEACYSGTPTHPVMVALQETIRRFDIPTTPFLKLIEANRMDQRVHRYSTYNDLLHYCDHSANPVGHLFLYLFGYRDEDLQHLSDATCTALQLTNFWQDVARDYAKGRIYLPQEDLERFGYTESELGGGVVNHAFRQLLAFEVSRTRDLFARGAELVGQLDGVVKLDVALFTRGGVAVLDAIQRQNYDVLTVRPYLKRTRKAGLFLSTWLTWKLGLGLGLPTSHAGGQR